MASLSSLSAFSEFLLLTKKYGEYKLVYKEHGREIKELFPEK